MSRTIAPNLVSGMASVALEASEEQAISASMRRLNELVPRIAPTDKPVLILGPTGSGKEVLAQRLHRCSPRNGQPFVDVNCSSIPENLIEAELFGHERGAFTGAVTSRLGHFATVRDGTLFLDEIGDLPLAMQPKLLRVLETRQFRCVGSSTPQRFEGRIVAATHRDLGKMVHAGTFREDLFYRLNVFVLELPGLDQRREDIPPLVRHFAQRQHRPLHFREDALQALSRAHWPGNVRQLRNFVDRIAVLSDHDCVDAEMIQSFLPTPQEPPLRSLDEVADQLLRIDGGDKISAVEHLLVDRALRDCGGNKSAAAKILGVNRKVVERRVHAHVANMQEARQRNQDARALRKESRLAEAITALSAALNALRPLPPSDEERRLRFDVLHQLEICKRSVSGWLSDEALRLGAEALRVGRGIVDPAELNALLFGSWTARLMRLELGQAKQLAREIQLQGIGSGDAQLQIEGCLALANTQLWLGEFVGTLELVDEFRTLPESSGNHSLRLGLEPQVLATMLEALAAERLGDELRTLCASNALCDMCSSIEHAYSLAIALQGCAWTRCLIGSREETRVWAERLLRLSERHSFAFYGGVARILLGFGVSRESPNDAEKLMRDGFVNGVAVHGGLLFHSFYRMLAAQHHLENGRPQDALIQSSRGIEVAMAHHELAYLSELHFMRGQAHLEIGCVDDAEEDHGAARSIAEALGSVAALDLTKERLARNAHRDPLVPASQVPQSGTRHDETSGTWSQSSTRSPYESEDGCA